VGQLEGLIGPISRKKLEEDEKIVAPIFKVRHFPLSVLKAEGPFIIDSDGKRYIDFSTGMGATILGHRHPKVISAIMDQLNRYVHICAHVGQYDIYTQLAKRLSELTGGILGGTFLCNSGTEANEGALKFSLWITGRHHVLAYQGSFHGMTAGSLSLTSSESVYKKRNLPLLGNVSFIPYPYCYRCYLGLNQNSCSLECLTFVERYFETVRDPEDVAAIFLEPIQGDGGVIVPPAEYLHKLQKLCRQYGVFLVLDEIQTGFGRTGDWFAFQKFKVKPDIITLGKGIANGLPLGAILVKKELIDKLEGVPHGSTFGGNPLSCRAALETIQVIIEEKILDNVQKVGRSLKRALTNLKKEHFIIGDVRGEGLMLGIEFIRNPESKEPLEARSISLELFKKGFLVPVGGTYKNVLRLLPPLNISEELVESFIETLEEVVTKIERRIDYYKEERK